MIFLRHPHPEIAAGICYGRLDVDIGPRGFEEIAHAVIATPRTETYWSSPAKRCLHLGHALARRDAAVLQVDARLHELDFGQWEGQAWTSLDPERCQYWAQDPMHRAPPRGETYARMLARVRSVLAEIPHNAVIICHAGVIRAASMILCNASFDTVFATPVPYARPLDFSMKETPWPDLP